MSVLLALLLLQDPQKVDEAIRLGCHWLLGRPKLPEVTHGPHKMRIDEFVLYTLVSAKHNPSDRRFQALLERVLNLPLDRTYNVSVRAMALAELDPARYQQELAKCAQFLVDNQCKTGQWGYGEPVPLPQTIPTSRTGPLKIRSKLKPIEIKRSKEFKPKDHGDNSNSQYAILGLRACLTALVVAPKDTILAAEQFWEKDQHEDGGWGYGEPGRNAPTPDISWGSMTAGGAGSLVILKYYLKRVWNEDRDWKTAASIGKAIQWLAAKWSGVENPNERNVGWHYYYLYAIERFGRLAELDKIGPHEWYPIGAKHLLATQNNDGSWKEEQWGGASPTAPALQAIKRELQPGLFMETCFAILFLRRGTPTARETLIETGDAKK
jgi:hypothetical protein